MVSSWARARARARLPPADQPRSATRERSMGRDVSARTDRMRGFEGIDWDRKGRGRGFGVGEGNNELGVGVGEGGVPAVVVAGVAEEEAAAVDGDESGQRAVFGGKFRREEDADGERALARGGFSEGWAVLGSGDGEFVEVGEDDIK
jgi:hypothetical protein